MSQYEQENDLGKGGGEVDDEALGAAWERSEQVHNAPVDPDTGLTSVDDEDDDDDAPPE